MTSFCSSSIDPGTSELPASFSSAGDSEVFLMARLEPYNTDT